MNSKEALKELYHEREDILGDKVHNKTKTWCQDIKHYDNIGHYLIQIREDLDRLEEYSKLEEELGLDLITLFSALKYGVYYFASDGQLIHDYVSLTNNYIDTGAHDKLSYSFITFFERQILLFAGYGKNWARIKEELEGNKNGN